MNKKRYFQILTVLLLIPLISTSEKAGSLLPPSLALPIWVISGIIAVIFFITDKEIDFKSTPIEIRIIGMMGLFFFGWISLMIVTFTPEKKT